MTHRDVFNGCNAPPHAVTHHQWPQRLRLLRWAYALLLLTFILMATVAKAQTPTLQTILVYGDSLSAAYGLDPKQGWAHLLAERLQQEKFAWRVVNASISGETTAGGLARFKRTLLEHQPKLVVLGLGANDGLRGLPMVNMRANLEAMIREARGMGARTVLVGMQLPPNYGRYASDFRQTFVDVAAKEKIPLVPFLLEGIADKRDYFLPDNLHPNANAQPLLLDNIWRSLKPLLRQP